MINRYRKRFILVTMIALFVVLGIIMALINITNYTKTCKDSDATILSIKNGEGPFNEGFNPGETPPEGGFPNGRAFDREEKFRTRYFSVLFSNNENNDLIVYHTENIALSDEDAIALARTILNKNTTKGFYGQYRFNVFKNGDFIEVFVLDCAKERQTNNAFLVTSLIISATGYLIIFVILFIVSKIVVKPFYENMEKQKQFITDASHELKTPLTIMSADVEVLEIESGENEWLDSIKSQIERLTSMTKNLTLMAKMDEDVKTYELKDFNISNALKETTEDVTTLLQTKDKDLVLDVTDDVHINGNEDLIKELFMILLENAYKYSLGDVNVKLKKENKNVLILSADVSYQIVVNHQQLENSFLIPENQIRSQ